MGLYLRVLSCAFFSSVTMEETFDKWRTVLQSYPIYLPSFLPEPEFPDQIETKPN